ncbi:hypothetical protein BOW53_11970 [Solemya pervernicosa gill symbiont]|uniref:Thioredoxin-like fold domain-containing protein n=1 Tax=Solemya pervernicosa gill symbiont TaxID=642797 RepID=A0A1T2L2K8_9GAMM|nr:hypothetical protein BOW53_11970 [Solemya pervernicosa gill symbiont]
MTPAQNLQADAANARAQGLPILLVFSAAHCPFCDLLDEEILKPMMISGDYTDKVILRNVDLDEYDTITDFEGRKSDPASLAQQYDINMTPTMLLLDPRGRELVKRIRGIGGAIEYFGADLDIEIDKARKKLRSREAAVSPLP